MAKRATDYDDYCWGVAWERVQEQIHRQFFDKWVETGEADEAEAEVEGSEDEVYWAESLEPLLYNSGGVYVEIRGKIEGLIAIWDLYIRDRAEH